MNLQAQINKDFINYFTPDKQWCFLQRNDGVILVYKLDKKNSVYNYQEIKLNTLTECEQYLASHCA